MLQKLWLYRGFILGSVKREFQSRYQRSMLGALWTVLNPLAMILIYTLVFSEVMKARLVHIDGKFAYSIFLCAGTLTWGLFAEILTRAQGVFVDNANLLKKLSFPRLCLPFILLLTASINFSIILGLFIIFLILIHAFPGWVFLGFFPVLFLQILFATGLGMFLGVLNVFFRDIGQMISILLQFWFWCTPVVYPLSVIPARFRDLLMLNPMAPMIEAYHAIFLAQQWPNWHSLIPSVIAAIIMCYLGMRLFRRHGNEIVDEL